jgi:hypothetical protein
VGSARYGCGEAGIDAGTAGAVTMISISSCRGETLHPPPRTFFDRIASPTGARGEVPDCLAGWDRLGTGVARRVATLEQRWNSGRGRDPLPKQLPRGDTSPPVPGRVSTGLCPRPAPEANCGPARLPGLLNGVTSCRYGCAEAGSDPGTADAAAILSLTRCRGETLHPPSRDVFDRIVSEYWLC